MDPEEELGDDPVRLVAVMQNYLRFLSKARQDMTPGDPNAFTAYLYAELKALREGLIARKDDYLNTLILDSILAEINLLNDKDDTFNVDLEYRLELVEKGNRLLAEATLSGQERDRRAGRRGHSARQVRIQIAIDGGRIDDALELAQETMALHKGETSDSDRESAGCARS